MSTYIQNYGFTKTLIKNNNKKVKNEIMWNGDYDGNKANIHLDINDNGAKDHISMQLDNEDLMNILGIQPVEVPLEERLSVDFLDEPYRPITLEGALLEKRNKRKSHKRKSAKHINKRHHTKRHYRHRKYHTK
jgi:hypothetical protein